MKKKKHEILSMIQDGLKDYFSLLAYQPKDFPNYVRLETIRIEVLNYPENKNPTKELLERLAKLLKRVKEDKVIDSHEYNFIYDLLARV